MSVKPFKVINYIDKNGIKSSAIKRNLPNGTPVVLIKKDNLPADKALMVSVDTFFKKELPNAQAPMIKHGDTFQKKS